MICEVHATHMHYQDTQIKNMNHCFVLKTRIKFSKDSLIRVPCNLKKTINEDYSTHFVTEFKVLLDIL